MFQRGRSTTNQLGDYQESTRGILQVLRDDGDILPFFEVLGEWYYDNQENVGLNGIIELKELIELIIKSTNTNILLYMKY